MGVLSRLRFSLSASDIAQIQREWKVGIHRRRWNFQLARRMDMAEKTRETAALGFVAVHVTHRAAATRFFAEDVPRFERGAEFDVNIALLQIADARKAKLEVRCEPICLERKTRLAQIANDIPEIRLAKMREHPTVVNVCAPAQETAGVSLLPEFRDEAAQQEMLRETHPRVRRHFKCAQLDEAEATAAAVG